MDIDNIRSDIPPHQCVGNCALHERPWRSWRSLEELLKYDTYLSQVWHQSIHRRWCFESGFRWYLREELNNTSHCNAHVILFQSTQKTVVEGCGFDESCSTISSSSFVPSSRVRHTKPTVWTIVKYNSIRLGMNTVLRFLRRYFWPSSRVRFQLRTLNGLFVCLRTSMRFGDAPHRTYWCYSRIRCVTTLSVRDNNVPNNNIAMLTILSTFWFAID